MVLDFHNSIYESDDEAAVMALWTNCGLMRAWNDPKKDIARKSTIQPEWFLVGVDDAQDNNVIASAMFGYDGHRGWVNYLAVSPACQRRGYARQLMVCGEALLMAAGCPKLNLQLRTSNADVLNFYEHIGYRLDDVVSLGKRLISD
jgi:ribosomal protein S18 acetylase RimI-like enzyme